MSAHGGGVRDRALRGGRRRRRGGDLGARDERRLVRRHRRRPDGARPPRGHARRARGGDPPDAPGAQQPARGPRRGAARRGRRVPRADGARGTRSCARRSARWSRPPTPAAWRAARSRSTSRPRSTGACASSGDPPAGSARRPRPRRREGVRPRPGRAAGGRARAGGAGARAGGGRQRRRQEHAAAPPGRVTGPTRGRVEWNGAGRAFVPERFRATGALRAGELLSLAGAEALLGVAEFTRRPMAVLSQGEAQRVALAAALGRPAAVVVLDEPFTALDAAATGELERLLAATRARVADDPRRPRRAAVSDRAGPGRGR